MLKPVPTGFLLATRLTFYLHLFDSHFTLHGPSMFSVKAKIYGVLYKQASSIAIVIGQRQKAPNFSAFHWSPHGSLVSVGQHFITTNINTEIEIEADLNTELDQAMQAVHTCSCNS